MDCWWLWYMRLKEKSWDRHRSQLWTVSLSHDLCPQNSSSLPVTICSLDLTLPQTFGMWKLAQLSQNKQISFPALIAFSWSSACPHSNHCLNTLIKFKNVPITAPSSHAELDFQSTRQDVSRVTMGTLQGALISPAPPPPRPTLLQSMGLVHCKAQRCGWGRVDKKGNLSFS